MANASEEKSKSEKLKAFFMHRYFLIAVVLVCLSLLLWFVGDAFAIYEFRPLESSQARLIGIALTILAFVAWEAARWYRARRANDALLASLSDIDKESDSRASDEIRQLRERMEKAVELLKKQKFEGKHGKKLINELPWYIFIGAPGSGKTTALANCGLKFPLSGREGPLAIKGVGGTRNCDWWFANDAVFLDTAGRYATQESDQRADSKAWLGFLDLLKKFRPDVPINGAIVTLSVSDLVSYDAGGLRQYADSVRARIQELYEKFGIRFPIYLMVTKADLLAGFMQFFSDYGLEERSQVWGCTFPYKDEARVEPAIRFETEFRALEKRLNDRLVGRTLAERDAEARAMIYNFPQQFSSLVPLVKQFVELAFLSSRFDDEPMLRGIYVTSGTQEGTPIDRVLGTLSRALGMEQRALPASLSSGKSFFLKNLLQDVVFPEAGLVAFDEKRDKRTGIVLKLGIAALIVLSLGLTGFWVASYFGNKQLIALAADKVAASAADVAKLSGERTDLPSVLAALNKVRDLPYGYAERSLPTPLWHTFGLSQSDKLRASAIDSYRRLIGQTLLPRLAIELERQLRNPPDDQILYEALKAYLMLYDDKNLDPQVLEAWGERLLPPGADEAAVKDLVGHIHAALEQRPMSISYAKNESLVKDARLRLNSASLADRVFGRLKLIGASGSAQPFRLSEAAGPAASQVFARSRGEPLSAPFPAIFTRDGYHKGFKSNSEKLVKQLAAEEEWVLGRAGKAVPGQLLTQNVVEEMRRRYFSEYVRAWDDLLLDIRLKRGTTIGETILLARILSGPDSPLKRLIAAVAKETTLVDKADLKTNAVNAVTGAVVDATKRIVGSITSQGGVEVSLGGGRAPELIVDEHFERIRQLAAGASGQPGPLDQTLALLAEFSRELADLESKAASGAAGIQGLSTAVRLKAEAETMPVPVQAILRGLIETSAGLTAAANQEALKAGAGGAASLCEKAVAGRYPFVRSSKNEVAIDDFNSVFKPGGDLDVFFKTNLQNLVDTSGAKWKLREGADRVAKVSPKMLQRFQSADAIRQAFFRGSSYAGFVADLILLNPEAGQSTFEYDGETYKLGPGQANVVKLRWPGQRPAQPTRLFGGWGKGEAAQLSFEGVWSLFRLMDVATGESNKEKLKLNFDADGKKLIFELRSASIYNPVHLQDLQTFACPGKD